MRSPSNSLLFASILTQLPSTVSGQIQSAVHGLLNLPVSVVEDDCGTYLGQTKSLSLGLTGYIETATGALLNHSRIEYLLGLGQSAISIRSLPTCLSKGGVCKTCYQSSYGVSLPPGATVAIQPTYYIGNQYLYGDGVSYSFPLGYDASTSLSSLVFINDVLYPFGFTTTNNYLTLPTPPSFGEIIVIRSLVSNTSVFINELANTYSGDVIGITPASSSLGLPVKKSLYETFLAQGSLNGVRTVVNNTVGIPQPLLAYGESILSPLEAVLYYVCLYATFT